MNLTLGIDDNSIDSSSEHANVVEDDGSIGSKSHLRFSDIKSNTNLEKRKSFSYGWFVETIAMEGS